MDLHKRILSFDYEAQHFGFHPRTFLDLVYNVLLDTLASSLNQLKQHMMHEFKDIPPNVIHLQTDSILQELIKVCDKCIDKAEAFLCANVFSINPNAILPEDKVHLNPCTKEEDENIDKGIEKLKQRILEEKAERYKFKKIISEQKQVKERLIYVQNELKHLLNIASEECVTKDSVESFYSKLNYLNLDTKWENDVI